ncbi:MAG TPA: hypothetical protein VL020_00885 [Pseudomonadales bacterium]|nr:hypothetical protein [Pseudomonadales bacterium]
MNNDKISKEEALSRGIKTYLREIPCKKCGSFERYTSSNSCAPCARSLSKKKWASPEYSSMETERRRIARNADPTLMERKRLANKKWAEENPEKVSNSIKNWSEKNKERIREKVNDWRRKEYRENPEYRMRIAMSGMVKRVLSRGGREKDRSAEEILGYTKQDLVSHIEKQFTKRMTWDNYGSYWHIDHITPLSVLVDQGEPASSVNCLSNLRPITAESNQRKSDKIEVLI